MGHIRMLLKNNDKQSRLAQQMPKLINELRWTQGMKLINQIQSLSYYQVIKPFQTRPIKPQLLQPPRPSDSSHLPNRPLDVEIGQVPSRRMPKADLAKMFDWQSHTEHKYGKPKAIHHHTPSKLGFMTLGIPWHTSIWDLTLPYMTPHRWWVGSTLLGVLNLTKTLRDGFLMSIIGCSFLMQFGVTHPRHGWTSKGILWTWNHDHCRNCSCIYSRRSWDLKQANINHNSTDTRILCQMLQFLSKNKRNGIEVTKERNPCLDQTWKCVRTGSPCTNGCHCQNKNRFNLKLILCYIVTHPKLTSRYGSKSRDIPRFLMISPP